MKRIVLSQDQRLRACYRGNLTVEQAQAKLGKKFVVLELRPARVPSEDRLGFETDDATEVIFAPVE